MKTRAFVDTNTDTAREHSSTRERLINVGLDLMRRHGYSATGLQEILEIAGMSKSSFYHHFGSKEQFAEAVVVHYAALGAAQRVGAFENSKRSPLRRLRMYFDDLISMMRRSTPLQGCLLGNLSSEVAISNKPLRESLELSLEAWQSSIARLLSEAVTTGELPKSTNPKTLAGFLLNSWQGALLRSQASQNIEALEEFMEYTFIELLRI